MSTVIRRRAIVHGRVQGVGFRWSALEQARAVGLTGYVVNRADGTVETEAEGAPAAVESFLKWLRTGPAGASVARVDVSEAAPDGGSGFGIR